MHACAKEGRWEVALEILYAMSSKGVYPDRVCFNAAIHACGKGGQGLKALELLAMMVQASIYTRYRGPPKAG